MSDSFEQSGLFDKSLSMWKGLKQNSDGTFSYEDEGFDPIELDFYTAASIGEDKIVQDILERKEAYVNAVNRSGWSGLMYASYMGHERTVQCLLHSGADPNQQSPQGYTPLILSSMCGNDGVMHILMEKGAHKESVDKRGWSALFHAVSAGHQQTTEVLIKWGANCEIIEPSQRLTPLMEAAASGHEIIVNQLLHKGVDTTCRDCNGDDAHSLALVYGHMKIASLIERHKRNKKHSSKSGHAPPTNRGRSHRNDSTSNPCSQSGPSIHDGPKAFAQMTGLGADGKPHPHGALPLFLQDQTSPQLPEVHPPQVKWEGPKDLESLLSNLGFNKYLPKFKAQDIDLHVFLTLNEADLKEIGIELFGPRRKMMSTISRLRSDIQTNIADTVEHIYADTLSAKLQGIQAEVNRLKEEKEDLDAQVAQERQLRKVSEDVLMEKDEKLSNLMRLCEKCSSSQARLLQTVEQVKLHSLNIGNTDKHHSSERGGNTHRRAQDKGGQVKIVQELESAWESSNECLRKMQKILKSSLNNQPPVKSNGKSS